MIPGELLPQEGEIELNCGRATITLRVANTGDRVACEARRAYQLDAADDRAALRIGLRVQ